MKYADEMSFGLTLGEACEDLAELLPEPKEREMDDELQSVRQVEHETAESVLDFGVCESCYLKTWRRLQPRKPVTRTTGNFYCHECRQDVEGHHFWTNLDEEQDRLAAAIAAAHRRAAERADADRSPREPTEPADADRSPREPTEPADVADPRLIWQPVGGGHVSMIRDVGGFFEVAYIPDTDDFFDAEFESSVFRFELTDEAAARAYAQELIDARPLPARALTQAELDAWSEGPLETALEVERAAEQNPPPIVDLPAYDVELIEQGSGNARRSYRVFAPSPRGAAEMALWLFERRLRPIDDVLAKVWVTSTRRDPRRLYPVAAGDDWWEAWQEPPLEEIALWAPCDTDTDGEQP